MTTVQNIIQFILFQITWITAALGFTWFGSDIWSIVPLVLLGVTVLWSPVERFKKMIIVMAVIMGIGMDASLSLLGVYHFPEGREALPFIDLPYWLLIMWAGFSVTLVGSTLWLLNRTVPFVIFCGVFGPFSYWIGMKLGIIEFQLQWLPLMIALWSVWGWMMVWSWGLLGQSIKRAYV